jgi:hypothetical protein
MIVTYLRNTDASEKELEALAIYMGNIFIIIMLIIDNCNWFLKVIPLQCKRVRMITEQNRKK